MIPFTRSVARQFLAHQPVWIEPSSDPDYTHWLALHGIDGTKMWLLPQFTRYSVIGTGKGRVPIATIPTHCHALNSDGSCALYQSDDRPQMCADWPWEPLQLATLSPAGHAACGYRFEQETTNG